MVENKKYYINEEQRVVALRDFSDVKKGDIGGFIEKESNLSHYGDCWVYNDAEVSDNAWVFGNAKVYDHAKVFGDARVYGDAKVFGNARVYGDAEVCDDVEIYGYAKISFVCSKSPIFISDLNWPVTITDNHMRIGCQGHSFEEWKKFTDEEIDKMDEKALKFWKENKDMLLGFCN